MEFPTEAKRQEVKTTFSHSAAPCRQWFQVRGCYVQGAQGLSAKEREREKWGREGEGGWGGRERLEEGRGGGKGREG